VTTNQAEAPAIRVQGVEKSFKDLHVLRGVDFDVSTGSIFALLGSNGAGKTTLVRILSTLLKADAGTATVHSYDVAGKPADVRQSISLTGQFAAVDEVLTGRENLVLVAKLRHLKNPGAIADDLLARFALTDAGNRKALTYSGGMRRRLDIAMSLIGNPPIIFLDEPTTGLDPQARIEVWQTVKQLAKGGTTVLLTTQYLDEAEQLADRIAKRIVCEKAVMWFLLGWQRWRHCASCPAPRLCSSCGDPSAGQEARLAATLAHEGGR
jgi:ABC-2 type transport system ATP-binding protein